MLLGGAAAAWPVAARARQSGCVRRVGVLMNASSDDADGQARVIAFVQALQELGWTDGRNARIDIRWGAGDAERYRRYAEELVALAPGVILAPTGAVVAALQRATRAVPIVFTSVIDPVGAGFVANLARPAAIRPASRRLNMASVENGLRYSRRSRPASSARRCLGTRL